MEQTIEFHIWEEKTTTNSLDTSSIINLLFKLFFVLKNEYKNKNKLKIYQMKNKNGRIFCRNIEFPLFYLFVCVYVFRFFVFFFFLHCLSFDFFPSIYKISLFLSLLSRLLCFHSRKNIEIPIEHNECRTFFFRKRGTGQQNKTKTSKFWRRRKKQLIEIKRDRFKKRKEPQQSKQQQHY